MAKSYPLRDVIGGAAASAVVLTTSPLLAAEPIAHDIAIKALKFEPDVVQVHVGDTIRWTNHDLALHTATADEFGWDTAEIAKNETAEITVIDGMENTYFCIFHPHMKGSIEIL